MPRKRKKEARLLPAGEVVAPHSADSSQVRTPLREIDFQRLDCGAAQRNNALFIALAAHLHAAHVEREIAGVQRSDLGNPQAAGVKQFQNGSIAQRRGLRLRMIAAMAARSSISATSGSATTWAAPSTPWGIRY